MRDDQILAELEVQSTSMPDPTHQDTNSVPLDKVKAPINPTKVMLNDTQPLQPDRDGSKTIPIQSKYQARQASLQQKQWSLSNSKGFGSKPVGAFAGLNKDYPIASQEDIFFAWNESSKELSDDSDYVKKRILAIADHFGWTKLSQEMIDWAAENGIDTKAFSLAHYPLTDEEKESYAYETSDDSSDPPNYRVAECCGRCAFFIDADYYGYGGKCVKYDAYVNNKNICDQYLNPKDIQS